MLNFAVILMLSQGGEKLGVSEKPFNKRADTFLARVHPINLEVWDIRAIEPNQASDASDALVA